MSIVVTKHKENLKKHYYVVTIEDNGEVVINAKNIGCMTTESGELDTVELQERITRLVLLRRAEKPTANVNINLE
tara:strand:+ start:178 stop:402 length:225 start_codon:yes stop_codon:yes gene_type:complete